MLEVMEEKDTYLSSFTQFEKSIPEKRAPWIHRIRTAAIERFAELGFPTVHEEEWRFTNVAPIAHVPFQLAEPKRVTAQQLERFTLGAAAGCRLVFVNGHYARELSAVSALLDGVVVDSLAAVLSAHPAWAEPYLARHAKYDDHAFVALNTAFIRDGAFVSIPKGRVLREPIHLLFVSTPPISPPSQGGDTGGVPAVSHPRNLIVVGVNSQATIVETYAGLEEDLYFTNAVTEIVLGENAVIDHYKVQQETKEAFHVATQQVHQDRSSNFTSHAVTLGGALVRNDVNAVLGADGCECTLNGLYLGTGRQHIDNHTRIDHAQQHGTSHELYKGILDGRAHGVFNGKIYVHPDAQKTDAKQTNKTLLLSEDAVINTKPQLEIYADDVKCTHGATVGQLAEEAIFYLRSRGIGREDARSLLIYAFANDIVSRIKVGPIRALLEEILLAAQRLPPGWKIEEAAV